MTASVVDQIWLTLFRDVRFKIVEMVMAMFLHYSAMCPFSCLVGFGS